MTLLIYAAAALCEIAGCFGFWAWLRLGEQPIWAVAGGLSLLFFGYLLTLTEPAYAGRAFAAYGGIYICGALLWLWLVEGVKPDRLDLMGATLCIAGAAIIVAGHRG
jgi:small multidrug resistance family-3 protein